MRYIDYLKMSLYYQTWALSIAIVVYNIGNRFGLIDTIHNPIEIILLKFVMPAFLIPLGIWWYSDKNSFLSNN